MQKRQQRAKGPGDKDRSDPLFSGHQSQRTGLGGTSPAIRFPSPKGSTVALLHPYNHPCTVYRCIERGPQKLALAGWRRNAVPASP